MIGQFEELLDALGKVFHLKLKVDHLSACSIKLGRNLTLQLQLDPTQENLWIFVKLAEIPPGKFREDVLFEALKANGAPGALPLIFGYIANENALAAFQSYPLSILTGERLAGLIGAFVDHADEWNNAISRGRSRP